METENMAEFSPAQKEFVPGATKHEKMHNKEIALDLFHMLSSTAEGEFDLEEMKVINMSVDDETEAVEWAVFQALNHATKKWEVFSVDFSTGALSGPFEDVEDAFEAIHKIPERNTKFISKKTGRA